MKVERYSPPPVEPEVTFDIKGLTLEEAIALRDLVGRFTCNPDPESHWHTKLYCELERAVTKGPKRPRPKSVYQWLSPDGWIDGVIRCKPKDG